MGLNRLLLWAAALLSVTFVGGLVVLAPVAFSTLGPVLAIALVLFSIWLYVICGWSRSADINLGVMGISVVLCTLHLAFSVRTLLLAVGGDSGILLVSCMAGFAGGLLIILLVRGVAGVIGANIARNDTGGEFPKIARTLRQWGSDLEGSDRLRADLLNLADELQYYPRVIAQDGPLDPAIHTHLEDLQQHLRASALEPAAASLAALRRVLDHSRQTIQAHYSKV